MLEENALLLKEGMSMLKDVKVKLQVCQGVTPKPEAYFALKGKDEIELESLEAPGIISLVSHSDWACHAVMK